MKQTSGKKKVMLAAILTSGLALAITQSAFAEPAPSPQTVQTGMQNKGRGPYQSPTDPAMQKAREKFLTDTVVIRKEMAEKQAVMRALLNAGTPDTAKASQLAGELFELREKLRVKAQEAGLPMPMMMGMGGDMGTMPCQGMGGHHRMM